MQTDPEKCTDDAVSNKDEFPNFARTFPPETQRATSEGMEINHKVVIPGSSGCCNKLNDCECGRIFPDIVKKTKDGTRIYVFLGSPDEVQEMLYTMSLFGLLDGRYMVIYIDLDYSYSERDTFKYMWRANEMWELIRNQDYHCQWADWGLLRGLLVVLATPPQGDYHYFTERVREYNKRPPFNITQPDWWMFKKHIGVVAAYLYDSVIMYVEALHRTISDYPSVPLSQIIHNGSQIIARIRNQTFTSVMGSVIKMDDNGDSEGNFTVLALSGNCNMTIRYVRSHNYTLSCHNCMKPFGQFYLTNKSLPEFRPDHGRTPPWDGSGVPIQEPVCGYDGMKCSRIEDGKRQIAAGVLGSVVLLATIVMLSIYWIWKEEQEIVGLLWKIDAADLVETGQPRPGESPSKLSQASIASYESKGFGQIFTLTGRYRGITVRIQNLNFSKKVDISRAVMKEIRTMRELRHQNVNSFLGGVVEPSCFKIVSDYCTRGSLPDILEGDELNLEYMFIAELIRDLVKGMLYLHTSTLLMHGNLKSSNCVVTSRWVLKVTDFGLHELRTMSDRDSECDYQYYKSQLWKSPEQLRSPPTAPHRSQADDVYAFGIILHEIMCREGPFGSSAPREEPKQIVERVQAGPGPGPDDQPFRPSIGCLRPPPDMPAESEKLVVECMQQCWNESDLARPTFLDVKKMLQPLRSGLSVNLVNQMMEKMEKYANNLEDLVRERTHLLNEEKQKTEALLYRMLPPPVAYNLTRGIPVQPETFDSVTIYFSDIVGFTQISADSSPLQVVELLNDLYTLFDDIIQGYDVYKVETIGDAYMVVSGVPERNGIRHAGEIASMALSLLQAIRKHTIQHRPSEQLKLRIGVHTGQVVAGVVGLTMPRYCLFGDTVNTASRIESTGEPLRIHISDRCHRTLARLGGYRTEPRGPVPMKGKGLVETHWLLGADAGTVQRRRVDLPSLPPLFSRSSVCHGTAAQCASTLSLPSERTRGSAAATSGAPSPAPSRSSERPNRLAVPRCLHRPNGLPPIRESRSLENFRPAPRLSAPPHRRDSRSVGNCRDLGPPQDLGPPGEVQPLIPSPRLLQMRLASQLESAALADEEEAEETEGEEAGGGGGEAAGEEAVVVVPLPPAAAPPAWDCLKDWFRRFFSRHRLEPPMPLNGKLKHNGYSLHSSHDTAV
ncbi:receptor-type guanylate cyclase Gyc76C-like isoform X2 [Pollicipes pollicipes]|uniref:receptor-type guanylate cyclase Gyc76C-like isoform X2 n=1 Tax=Pollicipes pollicipes TaxID=41117 RepID=UPI001884B7D3|nr:receptor-type guanylate cyclase Gyc76C-like isoform X2 [Pollicipes pollicipes]